MKDRPKYFIGEDKIDHNGEIFDYIRELHHYLWRFVNAIFPEAQGSLRVHLDNAIEKLENKENNILLDNSDLEDKFKDAMTSGDKEYAQFDKKEIYDCIKYAQHYHKSNGVDDICDICGHDLFHRIHIREEHK